MADARRIRSNEQDRWPPVRLPPEMYEQLAAAAGENQRTIAGEARYAISVYLRGIERRKQQAPA